MSRTFHILHREESRPEPTHHPGTSQTHADEMLQNRDRRAVADDEVMKLVQTVFILPDTAQAPGAVAFCGVEKGAGCSWVCTRAGEALGEKVAGSVCIVDANLRSPSLHEHFHLERRPGFAEAIRESRPIREYARRFEGTNLWLITAGAAGNEPNGALNPERLRTRFLEMRSEFDCLLVDTPPASSYPDAVLLGQLTDGVVLVVGSNSTRRESARIAKESFKAARIPILGAVLNKRTYPIPEALYQRL
jgi:Mrp family chromosome partitioning ATPase